MWQNYEEEFHTESSKENFKKYSVFLFERSLKKN